MNTYTFTSQEIHNSSATEINTLILFAGRNEAVYCQNHAKHSDILCGQNAEFYYGKTVVHIVTCRVVRMTRMTGSSSDDWIY
jgi:hypothetical protein